MNEPKVTATPAPNQTNQSDLVSEEHERSVAKMQITHHLANKPYTHDFSKDEMEMYGEVVFGQCHWELVGGWVQDEYMPHIEANQKRRASILVIYHRLLDAEGNRRFSTPDDLKMLVDFRYPKMLISISSAILGSDNDPSADLYTVTEKQVQEQAKN